MNQKVTLSFDNDVIQKAKKYAAENNISLSRLIEYLLTRITANEYRSLEDFPIDEWVQQLAEGKSSYQVRRSRKAAKKEFFESKK